MKKALLFFTVSIAVLSTKGQNYHKLINESFYWDVPYADMGYICSGFGDSWPYRYRFSGDTIIDGKNYSKIYYASFINLNPPPTANCPPFVVDTTFTLYTHCFLREDTVEQKVWKYSTVSGSEELLYDFTLQQGDTLGNTINGNFIVDTIYYILTDDGALRKKIVCNEGLGGYYIEGIGGIAGLFEIPFQYFEEGTWLMCVKDIDNNHIWGSAGDCYDFITNTPVHDVKNSIKVYPIPAIDFLYIQSGLNIICHFEIRNPFGQLVKQVFDIQSNQLKINIADLPSGLYIYTIKNNNMIIQTGKLIIH